MSSPRGYNRKTKSNISDQNAHEFAVEGGRIPPQAIDLEEALLGAILLDRFAFEKVCDILAPTYFYKYQHQVVFEAARFLYEKTKPIDLVTVTEQLKAQEKLEEAGGPFFLASLTQRVGSAANVEYHARIIAERYIQRELIRVSSEIHTEAFDRKTDVFEMLDNAERKLFEIAGEHVNKQYNRIEDLLQKALKQIEDNSGSSGISGVPSGFEALDNKTLGFHPNNLVILAARPGMGKTALAMSMARNAAVNSQMPVAIFSLEMEAVELVTRLLSSEAEINSKTLKSGKLSHQEWEQLSHKVNNLSQAKIYIDDTPSLTVFQLRAKCRRLVTDHKIKMVVIDYLQLMKVDDLKGFGSREQEIAYISRSLKSLAKELKIPIIALAQLNREADKRGSSGPPKLSDLRESGSIEQDADMVMFIHRPEYYQQDFDAQGNSTKGQAQVIISKHRNGETGEVILRFTPEFVKFDNWEHGYYGNDSSHGMETINISGNDPMVRTLPSKMNPPDNGGNPPPFEPNRNFLDDFDEPFEPPF